jgi:N-acetylmuramic acid 6-phosphate etherase
VSNFKLKERATNIIRKITDVSYDQAKETLELANNEVKTAIVMLETGKEYNEAKMLLEQSKGYVRKAIELSKK